MTGYGPENDRRQAQRESCNKTALITDCRGEVLCSCNIENMSSVGALISLPAMRQLPGEICLVSMDREVESVCAVIWRIGNQIGLNYIGQFSSKIGDAGSSNSPDNSGLVVGITSRVLKKPILVA